MWSTFEIDAPRDHPLDPVPVPCGLEPFAKFTGEPGRRALQLALTQRFECAAPHAEIAYQLHFNYEIDGDRPAWRPLRAFDDGQKTYVEFPASLGASEAPPLFLVDAEGKAELVNYRLQGRFYIVDRIFDAAELRLGLKKQQVVRISRVAAGKKRRGA